MLPLSHPAREKRRSFRSGGFPAAASLLAPLLASSLAFAVVVVWAYVTFSQYFLIWNANVPEETFWYNIREFDAAIDSEEFMDSGIELYRDAQPALAAVH